MNLRDIGTDELQTELKRRSKLQPALKMQNGWPDSPVGKWRVTTEGDIKGRSTNTIGVFEGHVVDIALKLRKKCYYSLTFHPFVEENIVTDDIQIGDGVSVVLDIESGTWGMSKDQRARAISAWINKGVLEDCKACDILENNYYASVKIIAR